MAQPVAARPRHHGSVPRRLSPRRAALLAVAAVPGLVVLAGCGGTAPSLAASSAPLGGPVSASAASPSASEPAAAGTDVTITVKGNAVTPSPRTVDVPAGTPVRLTVTADRTTQLHVHVVNIEKPVTAGTPTTVTFTPTQTGVYEVELHDPDLLLVKLAVR